LLVQKQTIPQKKALILSFFELESLRAWRYQEQGFHALLPQKDIEKKVNLMEQSKDAKKNLIAPIFFLYYEQSVCPLILNYKVYLVSSLNAKPTVGAAEKKIKTAISMLLLRAVFLMVS
jgi:hypothetical protein